MILSASRRTDIPCYYGEWFMNRLREGYVLTRNPMNYAQISRIQLSPEIVDCIVFWTKDAANFLPYLDELDRMGYVYYFQHTLTPYGKELERNLRPKQDIEDTFVALSQRLGRERVVWRYDPIILNDHIGIQYHKTQFSRMCEKLAPFTDTVTISFVDLYSKLHTSLIRKIEMDEMTELASFIGETVAEYGLNAVACCEDLDLTPYGIQRSSCIDKARIEKILGCPLDIKFDRNQRKDCGCCESIDIGAYNTCLNGCVYCYANYSDSSVQRNRLCYAPDSPILCGRVNPDEIIKDRTVRKNRQEQINFL